MAFMLQTVGYIGWARWDLGLLRDRRSLYQLGPEHRTDTLAPSPVNINVNARPHSPGYSYPSSLAGVTGKGRFANLE